MTDGTKCIFKNSVGEVGKKGCNTIPNLSSFHWAAFKRMAWQNFCRVSSHFLPLICSLAHANVHSTLSFARAHFLPRPPSGSGGNRQRLGASTALLSAPKTQQQLQKHHQYYQPDTQNRCQRQILDSGKDTGALQIEVSHEEEKKKGNLDQLLIFKRQLLNWSILPSLNCLEWEGNEADRVGVIPTVIL